MPRFYVLPAKPALFPIRRRYMAQQWLNSVTSLAYLPEGIVLGYTSQKLIFPNIRLGFQQGSLLVVLQFLLFQQALSSIGKAEIDGLPQANLSILLFLHFNFQSIFCYLVCISLKRNLLLQPCPQPLFTQSILDLTIGDKITSFDSTLSFLKARISTFLLPLGYMIPLFS